ncbi:unnamed protein product [Durusdinium trenchii]|uniref:Uncharacterized protein n=1 Tax=Durusdinium trenchii TaxID=1381693 RepID=A0ABP0HWA2_9DINO
MFYAPCTERLPLRETLARFGEEKAPLREAPENLPAVRPRSEMRQVEGRSGEDWAVRSSPLDPAAAVKSFREDVRSEARRDRAGSESRTPENNECERLRAHCEELLRLNASMRQQQMDITVGSFSAKFDNLIREFSQMRGFHQTLRSVVETCASSRKELKDLQNVVSPISEMSSLMEQAVMKMRSSLQEDMKSIVEKEVAGLREQLARIHENSTRMVGLTLANRKDFDEHRYGLSSGELDELLQLCRESKELMISNTSKLDITCETVVSNKRLIAQNAETINANKRSIEENRGFIQSNKDMIRDEQEKARHEAEAAIMRVQSLQDALRTQEHTLAERAALEKEISDSQQYQDAMEAEMNRLQDELQEGMKEEMEDLNSKIEAMLTSVNCLIERIDRPVPELREQLRCVVEISRRGHLEVNLSNGDVKLKRGITFKKKNPGDSPNAEFENEDDATEILQDIADLWKMFKVPVLVEGHTKDIGSGTDQFWQEVANSRAALCAATLGVMGVNLGQVVSVGKPGKSGLNKAALVMHFDLFPDLN